MEPFRPVPFRPVPFRIEPFRREPFRRVPFRPVPFRPLPFRTEPFRDESVFYDEILACLSRTCSYNCFASFSHMSERSETCLQNTCPYPYPYPCLEVNTKSQKKVKPEMVGVKNYCSNLTV
ncbi:hypothetical protein Hanom_Chr14g01250591 [Helianthus anomalus]